MTHQQVGLIVLAFAAWLPVSMTLIAALLRSREEKHKFKLYALRDDLLYLVASQKISEDCHLFRVFYGALTSSIEEIHKLTVAKLISASIEAKNALQKEGFDKFVREIEGATPEVREFVNKMFLVMREIMLANSPLLGFILKARNNFGKLAIRSKDRLLTKDACETYDAYRYYERMPVFPTNGIEQSAGASREYAFQ
jgi:hypothetical protein